MMNALMVHRGPDDEGLYVDEASGVGLGGRRLKVIDPSGGHQPLCNEDRTVWAVLNGEIYNFSALRTRLLKQGHVFASRTDTEVLVHLYEERGKGLVDDLEGMFAFAVWDSARRQLLLARDRFGEKPLFFTGEGRTFSFASELTALLAGCEGLRKLSAEAVDLYFVNGYLPGAQSIVERCFQLGPGELLVWDERTRTRTTETYWEPQPYALDTSRDMQGLIDETLELLDAAVQSRMIADVPLGVFLSGGLDSTLVAALAAKHAPDSIKTFTVDYDTGTVGEGNEARTAASAIDSDHHEFVLRSAFVGEAAPLMLGGLDQPLADPAFVALRALSEFARSRVTVAIGGEGADEIFGGYRRYAWLGRAGEVPQAVRAAFPARTVARIGAAAGMPRVARLADTFSSGDLIKRSAVWMTSNRSEARPGLYGPRLSDLARNEMQLFRAIDRPTRRDEDVRGILMRLDQRQWLPADVLTKADRSSMGASLEMRTPFLNLPLVTFASSVPARVHTQSSGKVLLRRALGRILPRFGSGRAKMAFRVPTAQWLRGPLAPLLDWQLNESRLYSEGWLNREAVGALIREHHAASHDYSQLLWPVLALGVWLDRHSELG